MNRKFARLAVTVTLGCWLLGVSAQGQPAATPEKVFEPAAKEVLERYLEVTGGRAAYERVTSRRMTLSLTVVGQGITGQVTMQAKAPNKLLVVQEITGMGQSVTGFDGEAAWEKSPMMGNRLIEGDELAQMRERAFFNVATEPEKVFATIRHTGEATVDGKPAHRIELINEAGTTVQFYDKESGLLVRQDSVIKSPMGELPVVMTFSDYKKVDGILYAHTMIQNIGPAVIETKLLSLEHNVAIPDDAFAVPADLKR